MAEKTELTPEQIETISGGTRGESVDLVLALARAGYGNFIKIKENDPDIIDYEGIQEFFTERGYKFIPASGDDMNMFVAPDGMMYGNDYVIYLLKNGQL